VVKARKSHGLTLLGKSESRLPSSPAEARLETFPNPQDAPIASVSRSGLHFPVPGHRPDDFMQIVAEYAPAKLCVETKSLKFYRLRIETSALSTKRFRIESSTTLSSLFTARGHCHR
jgi:NADPH-dependent 7-cyano-7-deazaguanine reductase QueF